MQLIDGKAISDQVKQEIAAEVAEIKVAGGKIPHLAAILVGHDGGRETYVAHKVKSCEQVGFKSTLVRFEDDATEQQILDKVRELNNDADIDGFIVQLPLPKHINEQKVIEAVRQICAMATRYQRRSHVYWFAVLRIGNTCRHYGTIEALQHRHQRQALCGARSQQYRRQTDCQLDDGKD